MEGCGLRCREGVTVSNQTEGQTGPLRIFTEVSAGWERETERIVLENIS